MLWWFCQVDGHVSTCGMYLYVMPQDVMCCVRMVNEWEMNGPKTNTLSLLKSHVFLSHVWLYLLGVLLHGFHLCQQNKSSSEVSFFLVFSEINETERWGCTAGEGWKESRK